jgi:hypothetical protein
MADETSTGSTGSGSGTKPPRTTAAKKAPSAAKPTVAKPATTRRKAASTNRKAAATKRRPAGRTSATTTTGKATRTPARKPASTATTPTGPVKGTGKRPAAKETTVIAAPSAFDTHAGAMTATIAVTRHLEWLDYALAAARAEESWRRDRLAKATKGNLAKRETRLAEVLAEIVELSALIIGLRNLQRRAAARTSTRSASTSRRTPAGAATRSRRTTDTGAG